MGEHHRIAYNAVNRMNAIHKQLDDMGSDLLNSCNVSGDVLDSHRVLDSETVALTFYPCLVDQDPAIRGQAYRSSDRAV